MIWEIIIVRESSVVRAQKVTGYV